VYTDSGPLRSIPCSGSHDCSSPCSPTGRLPGRYYLPPGRFPGSCICAHPNASCASTGRRRGRESRPKRVRRGENCPRRVQRKVARYHLLERYSTACHCGSNCVHAGWISPGLTAHCPIQGSDVEIGGGGVGAVQVEAVLAAEEEDAQHEAEAATAADAEGPLAATPTEQSQPTTD
jgi:hypothetical protein